MADDQSIKHVKHFVPPSKVLQASNGKYILITICDNIPSIVNPTANHTCTVNDNTCKSVGRPKKQLPRSHNHSLHQVFDFIISNVDSNKYTPWNARHCLSGRAGAIVKTFDHVLHAFAGYDNNIPTFLLHYLNKPANSNIKKIFEIEYLKHFNISNVLRSIIRNINRISMSYTPHEQYKPIMPLMGVFHRLIDAQNWGLSDVGCRLWNTATKIYQNQGVTGQKTKQFKKKTNYT